LLYSPPLFSLGNYKFCNSSPNHQFKLIPQEWV
jgi:hypothetical protein